MDHEAIQCPVDCHACCRVTTTLDLTATESLMIYLLNKDIVDLIEEYTDLHDETGYCPFMIMDKCIINRFKPSACQMFMPFEYRGKPMCYYLAHGKGLSAHNDAPENYMNSSSYAIHGVMMEIQCNIDGYLSQSFFKNIYQGTLWWKDNYALLPVNTRMCLESILTDNDMGLQLMENFKFDKVLQTGLTRYNEIVKTHPPHH